MALNSTPQLECKLCHTKYVDPHILQCAHSFCKKCIEELGDHSDDEKLILCPLCGAKCHIDSVKKNFGMQDLLEVLPTLITTDEIEGTMNKFTKIDALSLHGLTDKKWLQKKDKKLPYIPLAIRLFHPKLLVFSNLGVTEFTFEFEEIKWCDTIETKPRDKNIYICHDIVSNNTGNMFYARNIGGIVQRHADKSTTVLLNEEALELKFNCNQFFAVTNREVTMIGWSGKKRLYYTYCDLVAKYTHKQLTIAPRDTDIIVCHSLRNTIERYSYDGELLSTDENQGFESPYVCCSDNIGNVLIADCGNDRLLLRHLTGEYKALDLQPPVIAPNCAAYYDGKLFVTSWHHQKLYLYECEEQ